MGPPKVVPQSLLGPCSQELLGDAQCRAYKYDDRPQSRSPKTLGWSPWLRDNACLPLRKLFVTVLLFMDRDGHWDHKYRSPSSPIRVVSTIRGREWWDKSCLITRGCAASAWRIRIVHHIVWQLALNLGNRGRALYGGG